MGLLTIRFWRPCCKHQRTCACASRSSFRFLFPFSHVIARRRWHKTTRMMMDDGDGLLDDLKREKECTLVGSILFIIDDLDRSLLRPQYLPFTVQHAEEKASIFQNEILSCHHLFGDSRRERIHRSFSHHQQRFDFEPKCRCFDEPRKRRYYTNSQCTSYSRRYCCILGIDL